MSLPNSPLGVVGGILQEPLPNSLGKVIVTHIGIGGLLFLGSGELALLAWDAQLTGTCDFQVGTQDLAPNVPTQLAIEYRAGKSNCYQFPEGRT
jgi:hypothetical protein